MKIYENFDAEQANRITAAMQFPKWEPGFGGDPSSYFCLSNPPGSEVFSQDHMLRVLTLNEDAYQTALENPLATKPQICVDGTLSEGTRAVLRQRLEEIGFHALIRFYEAPDFRGRASFREAYIQGSMLEGKDKLSHNLSAAIGQVMHEIIQEKAHGHQHERDGR